MLVMIDIDTQQDVEPFACSDSVPVRCANVNRGHIHRISVSNNIAMQHQLHQLLHNLTFVVHIADSYAGIALAELTASQKCFGCFFCDFTCNILLLLCGRVASKSADLRASIMCLFLSARDISNQRHPTRDLISTEHSQ